MGLQEKSSIECVSGMRFLTGLLIVGAAACWDDSFHLVRAITINVSGEVYWVYLYSLYLRNSHSEKKFTLMH